MSRSKPSLLLALVVICALVAGVWGTHSQADDTPAPTADRGWSDGQAAATTAEALGTVEPLDLAVPAAIADAVTEPTALFYFSPTCPHCQDVMPEVNRIAALESVAWLGIAHGSATPAQMLEFKADYRPAFEILVDSDRAFAVAVGARSTPSVYVVEPLPADAVAAELAEGASAPNLRFVEAYTPFARGMGPLLDMRRHSDAPFAHFEGYIGDRTCAACHQQEALSQDLTLHSIAYGTLFQRDRAQDLACVGCHVTGLDPKGQALPTDGAPGFVVGDHGSPHNAVSCEACHGPSGPHDGERSDATATCVGCHDAEHSINFSVAKGMPHIDHFAVNALSQDAYTERLRALRSGEAERPLLAFPDAPTVGAATCKSCHKAEHKGWRKDPHGQAMASLDGQAGATGPDATADAGCVSCHATQQSYGGMGARTALSDFRTDEGVGCESCHGPGGDHAAQPRTDNIVGLGQSCPECVIEAVCTSCHTPKWDPGWELTKRLKAASHK